MVKARKVSQILFLLFFVFLFLQARYPYEDVTVSSEIGLRLSPLLPLFDFIDTWALSWRFWPALVILLFTPFLGRFFCGWICPLGAALDITDKIVKPPSNKTAGKWQKWRYLKYALLTAFILLALFGINAWGYFDPLALFNRMLTVIFYPLFTLIGENTLFRLSEISFLETPAYFLYDYFKEWIMPENQAFYQQVFWIGLLVLFVLGMEKVTRRFWCRHLCPAGALLGFLSQFRFYERIVGPACPVCNQCQTECKMNAIPADDVGKTNKTECIECFNCAEVCPEKISAITYQWRWKPYHSAVDYNRRQFLATSAASLAVVGLLNIGLQNKDNKDRAIRPHGALPEEQFQERCIRCMECVRICESNGGCLQPDHIRNDLLDLWLPVAVMRGGYCEYNCNLCGQVCPTEAILPLPLEEKQKLPMGLAHFDKDICIPYDRNEDCIVCEEHCPLPDKAIKFNLKDVLLADGTTRKVKYPYVIKELCIGCGICVNKCPLVGKPGIFVNTENQRRIRESDLM